MAQARELRRRIRSVQSTRQITRTMEMVSTSKLKRAQDRVVGARPYAAALAEVLAELYAPELAEDFPLLRQPESGKLRRAALLVITSNRGLCGAFNANLIREGRRRIADLEAGGAAVDLHLVGKKGVNFFRFTKRKAVSTRIDIGDRPTAAHAAELMEPLMQQFAAGQLDAVEVVFAKFNSAVSTPPTTLRILPVTPPRANQAATTRPFFILQPSAGAILEKLLPLYVKNQVYRALVETAAAEHGARRTAMKNATDSAGDMLDILRRTYNRARQAQITQEIAEIVGGAEALQG
ncbi:MAG TPA: ATP synthase F1 subunit gamma [Gemmatimonadales bacterium]|jgi:F-type H+-transporting ATPase subunit gamma|nr:ATP synthase F1 subunit gamma [Gemmatimonadales bacterium]